MFPPSHAPPSVALAPAEPCLLLCLPTTRGRRFAPILVGRGPSRHYCWPGLCCSLRTSGSSLLHLLLFTRPCAASSPLACHPSGFHCSSPGGRYIFTHMLVPRCALPAPLSASLAGSGSVVCQVCGGASAHAESEPVWLMLWPVLGSAWRSRLLLFLLECTVGWPLRPALGHSKLSV